MIFDAYNFVIQNGDSLLGYTILIILLIAILMGVYPFYVKANKGLQVTFRTNKWLQPNMLSYYRICFSIPLIFLYAYSIYSENKLLWTTSNIIFVILAMTDFWDGFFARMLGLTSEEGAKLDPLADKFFIIPVLIGLSLIFVIINNIAIHYTFLVLSILPISFEYYGQKIRGLYDKSGGKAQIIGKIKTSMMFIVCFFYIFNPFYIEIYNYFYMETVILYSLIIIAITSFLSMFQKTWVWNIWIPKALGL